MAKLKTSSPAVQIYLANLTICWARRQNRERVLKASYDRPCLVALTHIDRKPGACHDQAEEGKSQQEHQGYVCLDRYLKRENEVRFLEHSNLAHW